MNRQISTLRILFVCSILAVAGFAEAGEPNADALTFRELHTVLQVPAIDRPLAIAVAPDGDDIYVASLDNLGIVQMRRDQSSGTLTPGSFVNAELEEGSLSFVPRNVNVSPNGAFVYASLVDDTLGRAGIARFDRDGDGALSFGAGLPADEDEVIQGLHGPIATAPSPDGRHLYVLNDFYVDPPFYNSAIGVVSTDPDTGAMSFVQLIDLPEFSQASYDSIADITVSPDGQNVYVSRGILETIDIYTRNATTGVLTYLESADFSGISGIVPVLSIAVSPDGAHVYAMRGEDGTLELLDRASDGSLTWRSNDSTALEGAHRVVAAPDGERVYATSILAGPITRVSAYARDADTGILTLLEAITDGISGTRVLDNPGQFAVSADSGHLYVPAIGTFFSFVVVFAKDRPELPCEDFPAITDEYEALIKAYDLDEDINLDGLPEAASLALIQEAACANIDDGFDEAITNAYLINRAGVAAENEVVSSDAWDPYQRALASLRTISADMGVYLNEAFDPFDQDMEDAYIAVSCVGGVCEPANARNADEPFSGEGDPDEDGFTNAEEWANVLARGGDEEDFARSALDPTNDGTRGASGGGGGCFIATAAYGTPLAAELDTLRDFRDTRLLTNPLGTAFADAYYRLSPPIAEYIADRPRLRALVRFAIKPFQ